jgi:hypothetical protein
LNTFADLCGRLRKQAPCCLAMLFEGRMNAAGERDIDG